MDLIFQVESYDSFQMISEDILYNLHISGRTSKAPLDSNLIDSAKDYLRKLIIKCNFDIDNVAEQMSSNNWDQDRVKHFISSLKEKKTDVFHSIIIHHNSSHSDTIVDFDWLLKYILGSSEMKGLRYPSLQLILQSVNSSGDQKRRLYEMSKYSLSKLITILEDYRGSANNQQ